MQNQDDSFTSRTLFVWRATLTMIRGGYGGDYDVLMSNAPPAYDGFGEACPFCKSTYHVSAYPKDAPLPSRWTNRCEMCGFWYSTVIASPAYDPTYDEITHDFATLRKLDINNPELALDELGAHLKRRLEDVYYLNSRRFEELVADVYRQFGYFPRLTQQTRDGGYDILLLEQPSGTQVIVECKRYAKNRRIRVGTVRELLGVQLELGIPKAKIVATTCFTDPAQRTADKVSQGLSGYELELVDIDRFARALGIYNTKLPPLHLDSRFICR